MKNYQCHRCGKQLVYRHNPEHGPITDYQSPHNLFLCEDCDKEMLKNIDNFFDTQEQKLHKINAKSPRYQIGEVVTVYTYKTSKRNGCGSCGSHEDKICAIMQIDDGFMYQVVGIPDFWLLEDLKYVVNEDINWVNAVERYKTSNGEEVMLFLCPTCSGKGLLPHDSYDDPVICKFVPIVCRTCGGDGYINLA